MSNKHKIGIVDVGGGMRGAYSAGIYDWCLDNDVHFDYCIGVSAGSANLSSYLAGQRGRNIRFYTEYAFREEYMGMKNFVRTGDFLDLEYIYGTLSNSDGESPLDFDAIMRSPAEFKIVATDALSGRPYYFDKSDMAPDDFCAIKASSCVPAANKPYYVKGTRYYDGGMSDPVPVDKCWEAGCDKAVVVLTRPVDYVRDPKKDLPVAAVLRRSYPNAAAAMKNRAATYNEEVRRAREYEKQGRLLIIAPDDIGGMKTLTLDREMIESLYHKGYRDAAKIKDFIGGNQQL